MSERAGEIAHRPSRRVSAIAIAVAICSALAGMSAAATGKKPAKPHVVSEARRVHVATVAFADPRRAPVKVVRGAIGASAPARQAERIEIVSFGRAHAQVAVVRGSAGSGPGRPLQPAPQAHMEMVAFADPHKSPVAVVRGPSLGNAAVELFGPAKGGELDRIAFAVDGIESRHGADPGMWRPEPDGPQGAMQVSLKAALDVGGGDRFDPRQNRLLGRAYLAQLYRRYGNWADALAAYNWGPGNLDQWIAGGRRAETLPLEVPRYVERALRDALLIGPGRI
jgi:Transglycosylase SLT domain